MNIIKVSTIVVFFVLITFDAVPKAFSDGLTQENLPPASVGDRDASLFIKISPPILTKDTVGDKFLELKLFDAKTGTTIKHTSFFVTVDKEGKLLMRNLFHAHSGDLTIKIQPTDLSVNDVVVFGDREPFQGGWTSINDQVTIKAPILLDAGLYHFEIELFGIDNDRNIFIPADAPKFESWLSVGDIFNQKVSYKGTTYPVSIISYYDRIQDFKFDESKQNVSFNIPFNWDVSRIQKQNIFVHEEIHFPNSFKEFTGATAYQATVNGVPVTGRSLIADPYSLEDNLIVHFLINKENILDIASKVGSGTKTMNFAISPGTGPVIKKNLMEIKFDNGAIIRVQYDKNLGAGQNIPFQITFHDKDGKILKFVRYGFSVEDSSGKVLYQQVGNDKFNPGILSTEGIDTQDFSFSSAGTYKLKLAIFSHGQDNLQTYSGIASNVFEIGKSTKTTYTLPSWIKNNAGWWSEGKIGDSDFVQAIQYLIKNNIMKIPPTKSGNEPAKPIPMWIKTNAGWWSEGKISDDDFIQGIQWLVTNGVIRI